MIRATTQDIVAVQKDPPSAMEAGSFRTRQVNNCYDREESTASVRRKAARAVAGSMSVNATPAAMPTAIWIAASTGRDSPIKPPPTTVDVANTASDPRIHAMARARAHPSSAG